MEPIEAANLPSEFEQTSIYRRASTWVSPSEIRDAQEWLLPLANPDPVARLAAVQCMGNKRNEHVRVPLLVALHDSDERVRCAAAYGMVFFQDARAVEPLITVFQEQAAKRKEAAVARSGPFSLDHDLEMIASSLGRTGDRRVVEPLIAELRALDWRQRGSIAAVLGRMQDPRAVEPLLAALRETVARAQQLTPMDYFRGMPVLPKGLFEAVAVFRDRRAMKPLLTLLAFPGLTVGDRRHVVSTLAQMGDVRAVQPICDVLKMKSLWLRLAAARALGRLGDSSAIPALSMALSARSGHLRAAAARSLGQIGDERAVGPLLPLVHDSRISVRTAAFGALCQMGDAQALEPLLTLLQRGSNPQRRAAAKALGRIGDARARETLILALDDHDRAVQRAASKALERLRVMK